MPDVNILIYAHRRDERNHEFYRGWMEQTANSSEPFALSALVAAAFVRITTHPRFPGGPTPLEDAIRVIESLLAVETCHLVCPGPRHWELFQRCALEGRTCGKHVADAQHAAVAIEHNCVWVTRDPDFLSFRSAGLRLEILP